MDKIVDADGHSSTMIANHLPCPDCGSSDALSKYSDGHTYCYACQKVRGGDPTKAIAVGYPKLAYEGLIEIEAYTPLKARKLTQKVCETYGYGMAHHNGETVQVATYVGDDGAVVGQKLRYAGKRFKQTGHITKRFFGQHLFSGGRSLVVTEGEIDCLTVAQLMGGKTPVVSIPCGVGSARKVFKANLEWLLGFGEVVVMFDMDEPGRDAVKTIVDLLPPGKLKVATLPLKDPNECLLAGKYEEVITAIYEAKVYRPDGIIAGQDLWADLEAEPEETKGYDIPWAKRLTEMTGGLRKGEIVVVTAGTGIGKTTFVRQVAHHLGVHVGLKIGMMMLEESPLRTAKGLMSVHAHKRLTLNRHAVSEEEYKQVFDETLGTGRFTFYQHFGSLESENLLAKVRYLALSEQCDFIILDHITIAISGLDIENERKATDVLMTRLRSLVEETGVGMIVISHLKRVTEGAAAEEGGAISLSHLRGSHALAQLSDGVWALERDQQSEDPLERNLVRLRVLKNRMTGETGVAGYMRYEVSTDTLEAVEGDVVTNDDDKGALKKKKGEEKPQGNHVEF